jgi:hypothetical protein
MSKTEMMTKVIEGTMALYGVEREGVYPFVIGMVTAFLDDEDLSSMLANVEYLTAAKTARGERD